MKIAILSRGPNLYSTKRLKEAAENRGHEAPVVDYLNCNILIEKGEASLAYKGEKICGIDAMIPRIGASKTMYGSAVIRQFEMMDVFCACSSQALARSRDKLRSMQIMSRHGVGMPKTAFAHAPTEIKALIEAVGGPPLIIKLLEGTQGKGVVLAETYKAAKSALDAFYGLKANMLVQEFIAEAKSTDIRAFVVNGKVVGAMKRTGNAEDFRSNLHQGGQPEPMQKIPKDIRATAVNAANAMGLKIAGVDILPSDRGPLVMEVNSSPGLEGIEKATQKDIAGMVIQYLEDNAHKKHKKDKVGV